MLAEPPPAEPGCADSPRPAPAAGGLPAASSSLRLREPPAAPSAELSPAPGGGCHRRPCASAAGCRRSGAERVRPGGRAGGRRGPRRRGGSRPERTVRGGEGGSRGRRWSGCRCGERGARGAAGKIKLRRGGGGGGGSPPWPAGRSVGRSRAERGQGTAAAPGAGRQDGSRAGPEPSLLREQLCERGINP